MEASVARTGFDPLDGSSPDQEVDVTIDFGDPKAQRFGHLLPMQRSCAILVQAENSTPLRVAQCGYEIWIGHAGAMGRAK